jgi:hypothetical protein
MLRACRQAAPASGSHGPGAANVAASKSGLRERGGDIIISRMPFGMISLEAESMKEASR